MAWNLGGRFNADSPVIAAHRGFSACYPENTLKAFEEAAKLGVDMVELDISMSADDVPMLYHDDNLENKSTPLTGSVTQYTRDELRQVRIGSKLGMEDQPIATLEEVCQLYCQYPDIVIDVDLKPGSGVDKTIKPVMEILAKYDFLERVIFNSIDGDITRYLHENTDFVVVGPPPMCYSFCVNQIPGKDGTYRTLDAVCVPTEMLTVEVANELRNLHKIVVSAPMRGENAVELAVKCGVEIALCDDPRPYLRHMGRL